MDDQILPLAAPEYLRKDIEPLMYKGRQPTVRDVYKDALYNHLDIACYYDGNLIECVDKPVIGGYRVAAGVMCNGVDGRSAVTIIPLAIYKARIPFIPPPPEPKPAPHPPGGVWWDDRPTTLPEYPKPISFSSGYEQESAFSWPGWVYVGKLAIAAIIMLGLAFSAWLLWTMLT